MAFEKKKPKQNSKHPKHKSNQQTTPEFFHKIHTRSCEIQVIKT